MCLLSKRLANKFYLIILFSVLFLSSCDIFKDELDRNPPGKGLAGKYFWAFSKIYGASDTLGMPLIWDEIYYDISEFDSRSGTFNIDTYVNNQIVRHQVIVNRTSYYDSYYQYSWVNYIDESGQNHTQYSDGPPYIYFEDDHPAYFASRSYPFSGANIRNYFVKYSWGQ